MMAERPLDATWERERERGRGREGERERQTERERERERDRGDQHHDDDEIWSKSSELIAVVSRKHLEINVHISKFNQITISQTNKQTNKSINKHNEIKIT